MGYVQDRIVVVRGWHDESMEQAHGLAVQRFGEARVSIRLLSVVNGYSYFLVGGSGSKVDWPDAKEHGQRITRFVVECEQWAGYVDVLVVTVGEDPDDLGVSRG